MCQSKGRGFTLIELLIVVAIIAILAAIAVPNFLEAQVRAKVSRVKADMRSAATALEAYRVDETNYPPDPDWYAFLSDPPVSLAGGVLHPILHVLTTPIAYMTSLPYDVFQNRWALIPFPQGDLRRAYWDYETAWGWGKTLDDRNNQIWATYRGQMKEWVLSSPGPDQQDNGGQWFMFGMEALNGVTGFPAIGLYPGAIYDPTNGTISAGDIARVGP